MRQKGLSMVYQDGTEALHEVCFEIPEGESCSIIGPSGCGKTSLLFIFSGILKPTSGKALIAGKEEVAPSREVTLILQDYGLLPWKPKTAFRWYATASGLCPGVNFEPADFTYG